MLAMPRFFHGLLAFLGHEIGHHESLSGGQVNDGERARVFQSVQERTSTVVRRARVFDNTLSKAYDVRKTRRILIGVVQTRERSCLTYLINVGKIHLYQPYCVGGLRRLPPGSSMQIESQTSPKTFAYEVKMSAKITSEKCTRWFVGIDMHLLMLLY